MPRPKFKQKCAFCKKNMVVMYSSRQFPICVDCQMKRISDTITEKEYDFLNLPEEIYRKSSFLRSIKENYLRTGFLSEKQMETFKRVVKEMLGEKPEGKKK